MSRPGSDRGRAGHDSLPDTHSSRNPPILHSDALNIPGNSVLAPAYAPACIRAQPEAAAGVPGRTVVRTSAHPKPHHPVRVSNRHPVPPPDSGRRLSQEALSCENFKTSCDQACHVCDRVARYHRRTVRPGGPRRTGGDTGRCRWWLAAKGSVRGLPRPDGQRPYILGIDYLVADGGGRRPECAPYRRRR